MRFRSGTASGPLALDEIAAWLETTPEELGETLGVRRNVLTAGGEVREREAQTRLRSLVDMLNRMAPCFGSAPMAYAWSCREPLLGFGTRTALDLVREGDAAAVKDAVDAVDAGVHA